MKRFIRKLFRLIPDNIYIQIMYLYHFHKFADLKNPKTFNEKLQWLKLHDRNPLYIQMVDKYLVKNFVGEIIGKDYIIPTLGVWDKLEDINFDKLPQEFVLKWNHDSGSIVFCNNKKLFNKKEAFNKLRSGINNTGYWYGREWPYKNVNPKIIAEKYIKEDSCSGLTDYKVHCFNGKAKVILVCKNRYSKEGMTEDFFDINWEHLLISRRKHPNSKQAINAPHNLKLMIEFAEKLSQGIDFLRVDFYDINGKLFFGELTLYPGAGFIPFVPEKWDAELGNYLNLTKVMM